MILAKLSSKVEGLDLALVARSGRVASQIEGKGKSVVECSGQLAQW